MPAGHRNGRDHLLPQFVGELSELVLAQRPNVGGQADLIEQRSFGAIAHRARDLRGGIAEVTSLSSKGDDFSNCSDIAHVVASARNTAASRPGNRSSSSRRRSRLITFVPSLRLSTKPAFRRIAKWFEIVALGP